MKDLAGFLDGFVRPLVGGGPLHVGEAIDEERLLEWSAELDGRPVELEDIDTLRAQVAAELVLRPPPLLFGPDELRLAAAVHDLLVLAHPGAGGLAARRGRRRLAGWLRELATLPPPEGRAQVLGRHSLLHQLFELTREDTVVSWWSGHAQFQGVRPPRRLTRWASVRRVQEERSQVALADILVEVGVDAEDVLTALLAASPLTDLLSLPSLSRDGPAFGWARGAALLGDAELTRAVAYAWLADLPPPDNPPQKLREVAAHLRAPVAATLAWEQLALARTPAPEVGVIAAFLVHLATLCALAEADLDGPSPLLQVLFSGAGAALPLSERGDPQVRGAQLFFALPDLLPAVRPPGLETESPLGRRFAAHRAQVRAAAGEARLRDLAARFERATGSS